MVDKGFFLKHGSKKVIDCWWRGCDEGAFMIMLAYLISQSDEWENTSIRVIRLVANAENKEADLKQIQETALEARIEVTPTVIVSEREFSEVVSETSRESNLVIMGLVLPEEGSETEHHNDIEKQLLHLPTTLLVKSAGDVDLSS